MAYSDALVEILTQLFSSTPKELIQESVLVSKATHSICWV